MSFTAMLGAIAAAPVVTAAVRPIDANAIVGVWEAANGLKLEMYDSGDGYAARILWSDGLLEADGDTPRRDAQNPRPELRNRPIHGIILVDYLQWVPRQRLWEGGRAYDPRTGRTYNADVALVDGKMMLRAYLGKPELAQSVVFSRAKP